MGSFSRSSILCKLKRWISFQEINVANTEIDDNETISKIATQIFQQRNMLEKHEPHYLLKRSPFRGDELLCKMGFFVEIFFSRCYGKRPGFDHEHHICKQNTTNSGVPYPGKKAQTETARKARSSSSWKI